MAVFSHPLSKDAIKIGQGSSATEELEELGADFSQDLSALTAAEN